MYMKGAFRLEGAFYFSYFAIRAFFSARTISGISKMCTMIPGTAFAKAPARNAAQQHGRNQRDIDVGCALWQTGIQET